MKAKKTELPIRATGFRNETKKSHDAITVNKTATLASEATREKWICHGDTARRNDAPKAIRRDHKDFRNASPTKRYVNNTVKMPASAETIRTDESVNPAILIGTIEA